MRGTPLAPWQAYSARLLQLPAPASEEALRVAGEVCRLVDVPRERAERLARDCVERGEVELLLRAATRVARRRLPHPWADLLSEVIGGRRKKKTRRRREG